ncbi:MAG: RNA polymerase sigma factor [Saprospiraceae bacterium]
MTELELIEACRNGDRHAQKLLYERYAPKMNGVCMRYCKNREDAEDVLIEGFFKVLTHLHQFRGGGSFEGWIRRIMVNESLMFLRKRHNFKLTVEISNIEIKSNVSVEDELMADDILALLEKLPTGYRTIFNLYVLEGYKHREIAELLGISINTSKSQLILAKKRLRALLKANQYPDVG